jgi:hypothetical protein
LISVSLECLHKRDQQLQIPSADFIRWNEICHGPRPAPPIQAAIYMLDLLWVIHNSSVKMARTLGALRFIIREHRGHLIEDWCDIET